MSILHTLKRKLRSCRRQQDGVLRTFNEELAHEIQKRMSLMASDIHSLVESTCIWNSEPPYAEIRAFQKLSMEDRLSLINGMLARVHELRMSHTQIAQMPFHETQVGLQLWMSDLPKSEAKPDHLRGVRGFNRVTSAFRSRQ